MKIKNKFLCFFLLGLFFLTLLDIVSCINAKKESIYTNSSSSCYLTVYHRNYDFLWRTGSIVKIFSSDHFFIVYDKFGNKLKNSAWYFWEEQFYDLIAPKWMSDTYVLYPTADGWAGWNIPVCDNKDINY